MREQTLTDYWRIGISNIHTTYFSSSWRCLAHAAAPVVGLFFNLANSAINFSLLRSCNMASSASVSSGVNKFLALITVKIRKSKNYLRSSNSLASAAVLSAADVPLTGLALVGVAAVFFAAALETLGVPPDFTSVLPSDLGSDLTSSSPFSSKTTGPALASHS